MKQNGLITESLGATLTEYLIHYDKPFSLVQNLKSRMFGFYPESLHYLPQQEQTLVLILALQGHTFWTNVIKNSKARIQGEGKLVEYKTFGVDYFACEHKLSQQCDSFLSDSGYYQHQDYYLYQGFITINTGLFGDNQSVPHPDLISALEQLYSFIPETET